MKQVPLTPHRFNRAEYDKLVELGAFVDQPVELISGQLMVAEPKGSYHATTVDMVHDVLRDAVPDGWIVRNQNPVALDDDSEPEPDLAVVHGARADYRDEHPTRVALIVEVADSSLAFDRQHKGSLYARGGIDDYWIVNLIDRVLEVYRGPAPDADAAYGWGYRTRETFVPPAIVTPLALPTTRIVVAAIFP